MSFSSPQFLLEGDRFESGFVHGFVLHYDGTSCLFFVCFDAHVAEENEVDSGLAPELFDSGIGLVM